MTVSEIVSTLSLLVSAGALLYTVKSVNASRRATQFQIFDGIFKEIMRLDAEFSTEFKARNVKPTERWCQDFFNTLEYMAFLLNRKLILGKEMQDFYQGAVCHWYATFAATANNKDLNNPDLYPVGWST